MINTRKIKAAWRTGKIHAYTMICIVLFLAGVGFVTVANRVVEYMDAYSYLVAQDGHCIEVNNLTHQLDWCK